MKKLLLKSMLLLCALIVGSSSVWADDYELYSGTITEGDYVIFEDGCALKNTVSSNRWQYEEITPSNNKISDPSSSIVWHIAASGTYWTLYNESIHKYAASTSSKNQGGLSETITNNAKWTVTAKNNNTYDFENLARSNGSDSGNKWLRKNGNYGFACYASGTGNPLKLYKKVESTGEATTVTIDASGITNTDLAAGTAAGSFSAVVKNNSSVAIPSASVTWSSSNTAVATINETTGAVTLVKKGSTTITASYAGVTDTYQSSSNTYVLNVTNSNANDGSSAKPFTPSEAIDALVASEIDAETDYYVTGIIQSVSKLEDDNSITYWISDDGTATNKLECYKGKGISGATFAAKEDLEAGDIVTVMGKLTIYNNTTYEFTAGNQITVMTVRTKVNLATLTFSPTSLVVGSATTSQATATIDQPSCTTATYTYESLDETIATCTPEGVITPVAKGTARIKVTLAISLNDPSYKLGTVNTKLENITIANPSHTAHFSINGVIDNGNDDTVEEGNPITFPANPAAILGKSFVGWTTAAINGNQNSAPATLVTSANMGNADIIYYAVFAKASLGTVNASLTINKDTKNFPDSYGSSNKFTEYTLEGKSFKIQQAYVNGSKLQWRAEGNSNGTGTIYNTEALDNIQSIVLTYDNSDSYKNFNLKVGSEENPTSGTAITPSANGNIYTFDCSASDYDYFVLANGSNAGYLTSIKINYKAEGIIYSAYCTSIPSIVPVTIASTSGFATLYTDYALDFSSLSSELKAYTATVSENTVTLTEVDDIPANTGVVLKGDVKTHNIPVAASSSTAKGDLIGNTSAATAYNAYDGYDLYMLALNVEGKAQFTKVTSGSIAAGKAFLKLSSGADARELNVVFADDEPTAIETVKVEKANNEYFNLAGQRVAQPTKGLYIVNGKKVVVK